MGVLVESVREDPDGGARPTVLTSSSSDDESRSRRRPASPGSKYESPPSDDNDIFATGRRRTAERERDWARATVVRAAAVSSLTSVPPHRATPGHRQCPPKPSKKSPITQNRVFLIGSAPGPNVLTERTVQTPASRRLVLSRRVPHNLEVTSRTHLQL